LGQFCFLTDAAQLQFYKSGIWNNYPLGGSGPTLSTLVVTGPSSSFTQTYVDASNNIVPSPTATGFTIYMFNGQSAVSPLSFTIKANKLINISYLLVAGGGGGGAGDSSSRGGGGGAGGVIKGINTLQNSTTYNISIGGYRAWDGYNSSFYAGSGLITAVGGGIGATPGSSVGNGGSGGGSTSGNTPGNGIGEQGKSGGRGESGVGGGGGGYISAGSSDGRGGSGVTNDTFFGNSFIIQYGAGGIGGNSTSTMIPPTGFGTGGPGGRFNESGRAGTGGFLGIKFPSYS
jgi:hypothetical protein